MGDINSIVMSNEKIVDRTIEQHNILNEITSSETDLTIIYAQTGVGKSALTARIGRSIQHMQPIAVVTRPENKSQDQIEGTFLSSIFNAFVRTMQNNKKNHSKCTFEYYLNHNKNAIIKKKALEKMFDGIESDGIPQSAGWSVSKYVLTRLFRLYEYNSTAILPLRDRDSMLIASDYVKYVLNREAILLIVDNIQNIDTYSLQLVIDWMLLSQSPSYYLFEYTVDEHKDLSALMDFAQHLKNYTLKVNLVGLPYLKPDDALRAIELVQPAITDNPSFLPAAKKFYETQSKGSMRKLLDFSLQYQESASLLELYDPTYDRIRAASSESQYILGIIMLHGGQISDLHLRGIVEQSIDPIVLDLEDTLQRLQHTYGLVEKRNSDYQITHAQIGDAWNEHQFELRKFDLLANKNCIKYYENILNSLFSNTERKEDALLFLMNAYSKFSPEKLEYLIDLINNVMFDRLKPEQAWKHISIFLKYIYGKEAHFINPLYQIVRFCFDRNLYKNCLYVLDQLKKAPKQYDNDFFMIYQINCIEYLEHHEKAVELCKQRLDTVTDNRSKYYYLLLLMGCYRSLNQMDQLQLCVEQIKAIPAYDTYLEYGYFLRLSETYMSRQAALKYVHQSVLFFKERQMDVQEIKSGITYTFLMAVVGDLNKAYRELSQYEEMASQRHLFGNVFELNKASMLLLQGLYGKEVERLLKKAELSTSSPFDCLMILTMQLINSAECRNYEMTESLLPRIDTLLERECDKHLISLVSYDLYYFYKKNGQAERANKYRQVAEKTASYNQTVAFLLAGKENPQTPNLFHTPWCIGFTFFWNIDYEIDLQ